MATSSGRFIPKNPQKYVGNPNNIIFRSSWELAFLKFLDSSSAVLKYASEELAIPYIKPTDNRVHKYYPDFVVIYTDKSGAVQREIIEIKPLKESLAEKAKTDHDKIALTINIAKWKAAEEFAHRHDMKFRVITETSMFKQGPAKQRTSKKRKTV